MERREYALPMPTQLPCVPSRTEVHRRVAAIRSAYTTSKTSLSYNTGITGRKQYTDGKQHHDLLHQASRGRHISWLKTAPVFSTMVSLCVDSLRSSRQSGAPATRPCNIRYYCVLCHRGLLLKVGLRQKGYARVLDMQSDYEVGAVPRRGGRVGFQRFETTESR